MIITLQDAQELDSTITQDQLDAYESAVRQLTHNNFQVTSVRGYGLTITGDTVTFKKDRLTAALKDGDTVELNGTGVNDGLYTVKSTADKTVTLDRAPRLAGTYTDATLTFPMRHARSGRDVPAERARLCFE